jgi:thymidylate synthase (FAD)
MINILDKGHIKLIETWGSDESIIEAARMSTGKGFNGWGHECLECVGFGGVEDCLSCGGTGKIVGDEKLLSYLYNNKHMTPFEMAGMVIEVKAPIFVFREWHRHRTQSYNEMSARYIPLPDENYIPRIERIMAGANTATTNKQAQGSRPITKYEAELWQDQLIKSYHLAQCAYENGISVGVPKELARLPVPVARYSRMRASASLRNWMAFLTLRMDESAQWEIREYANAVGILIAEKFPQTWKLFNQEKEASK